MTVCCVFVKGEYPYTPDYVTRLRAMVGRYLDRPFRCVCLTDQPELFPDVDTIAVKKLAGFAPWTKLELFNPARKWTGRMLYLDLDVLIVAPLAPIVDRVASFVITDDPEGRRGKDSYGRTIVRRFNSSVMAWDGGTHTELYTDWTPAVAQRLSGDQDHLGEQLTDAVALPRSWFPRISEAVRPPWSEAAKVILVKTPKNHIMAQENPWFEPLWGAA